MPNLQRKLSSSDAGYENLQEVRDLLGLRPEDQQILAHELVAVRRAISEENG